MSCYPLEFSGSRPGYNAIFVVKNHFCLLTKSYSLGGVDDFASPMWQHWSCSWTNILFIQLWGWQTNINAWLQWVEKALGNDELASAHAGRSGPPPCKKKSWFRDRDRNLNGDTILLFFVLFYWMLVIAGLLSRMRRRSFLGTLGFTKTYLCCFFVVLRWKW